MKLDVLIILNDFTNECVKCENLTFTQLRRKLVNFIFYPDCSVFIKPNNHKNKYSFPWRVLPNRSTDFYRCPKLDISDSDFISNLFKGAYKEF